MTIASAYSTVDTTLAWLVAISMTLTEVRSQAVCDTVLVEASLIVEMHIVSPLPCVRLRHVSLRQTICLFSLLSLAGTQFSLENFIES